MQLLETLMVVIIVAPPVLLAVTLHELAHGYVAHRFGDPTAGRRGRLTLNPLKHLDPIGTLALFVLKIGWAKPVPVDPRYFKDPRRDMLWVALAGPGANLLLAAASLLLVKALALTQPVLPVELYGVFEAMLAISLRINLVLAVFNLIPIPPLDGGKILPALLPRDLATAYLKIEPYGIFLLMGLLYLYWHYCN